MLKMIPITALLMFGLAGCGHQGSSQIPTKTVPLPTFTNPIPTNSPIPSPTQIIPSTNPPPTVTIPPPLSVWIEPALEAVQNPEIELPMGMLKTSIQNDADVQFQIGQGEIISERIYVIAAAFPSTTDNVEFDDLKHAWFDGNLVDINGEPILISAKTAAVLGEWLGPYHKDGIRILPEEEMVNEAWNDYNTIAILPFEALEPKWKVLRLDNQSPLQKGFEPRTYPLAVQIGYQTSSNTLDDNFALKIAPQFANFQIDKLTNITLTGVTALVRGTALTMEAKGITYPAEDIRNDLLNADILHISNEIPFFSDCPPPELYPSEIKFCSPPKYIQLLEYIGADIIELDGDHFGDFGNQAMLETLQMYNDRNWPYYGGGATSNQARQPVFITHNGNKFAFIGCNAKGISYYATANETNPGAVQCDFNWLQKEITDLKNQGYLVIATFQHNEYYTYEAQPDLIRDFQRVAQAGAVIISGSQAHQPHGMDFFSDSFIHYGLGNLFFDQYRFFPGPELDRAFIDRHYFYAQQYISTELLTIKFVDLARSRLITDQERSNFLEEIFSASGW